MKRTKIFPVVKWRNTGRGTFLLNNRRKILSGEVFEAGPHEIPKAFQDVIKPLIPLPQEEDVIKPVIIKYELKRHGNSPGWWDVVNSKGKVINTKLLRKEVAEEMKKTLEG